MDSNRIVKHGKRPNSSKEFGKLVDFSAPSFKPKVKVIAKVGSLLPHYSASKISNFTSCVTCIGGCDGPGEVTIKLKDPKSVYVFSSTVQLLKDTPLINSSYYSRDEFYQLDSFYCQEDDNIELIFEQEFKPLIDGVFRGTNASVFAYGSTDSGKAFTLEGAVEVPGLTSLTMSKILSLSKAKGSVVSISYYEVYMEKCYDLLGDERKEVSILDDKEGKIHLKGLHSVEIDSISKFNDVLIQGIQRRKTVSTTINEVSVRSHAVLVMNVSTNNYDQADAASGKLNLVDLAGSEDSRNSCKEGIRLLESAKIKQSILALSNVIHALNNEAPRVPYRDSKLTRILQDSLGGTSRSLMIVCLNPANYQESVFTVGLAARSHKVASSVSSSQNMRTPQRKVDMETKLKLWLESQGKTKNALHGSNISCGSVKKRLKCDISSASQFKTKQKTRVDVEQRMIFCEDDSIKRSIVYKAESERSPMKIRENALFETFLGDAKENSFTESSNSKAAPVPVDSIAVRNILSPVNVYPGQPSTPLQTLLGNRNDINTPLAKFSASSSKLKSSLVQEYIELLNAATREELQELKGIGPKIADYIVRLREDSPIKTIKDLEKIGLSSKQINGIFSKSARIIFDI